MNLDAQTLAKYPLPAMLLIALGVIGYLYHQDKEASLIRDEKQDAKIEQWIEKYDDLNDKYNELARKCGG